MSIHRQIQDSKMTMKIHGLLVDWVDQPNYWENKHADDWVEQICIQCRQRSFGIEVSPDHDLRIRCKNCKKIVF